MAILNPTNLKSVLDHPYADQYLPSTSRNFSDVSITRTHFLWRDSPLSTSPKSRTLRAVTESQGNLSQKSLSGPSISRNLNFNEVSEESQLIREYVDDGFFKDAIKVYLKMFEHGLRVEEFRFFPCLIKAFGGLHDVEMIRQIHGHVLKLRFLDDIYVANALSGAYSKCGALEEALQVFDEMPEKDSVSWNTMLSGLLQSGDYTGSLIKLRHMIWECGIYPNRVGCLMALSACSSLDSLIHGREIHGFLVKNGLDVDEFLVSGLIEMYMKCGDLSTAEYIFDSILNIESSRQNTVIWNVMILGYVSNGHLFEALDLFIMMLSDSIVADIPTMVAVSNLCTQLSDLSIAEQIHGLILKFGLMKSVQIETSLIDMYFKCGNAEDGLKIFRASPYRNLVMWGTVITNYSQSCLPNKVLDLINNCMMEHGHTDSIILLAALRACSSLALKSKGKEIHSLVVKKGYNFDVYIGGALVDMYGKCGDIESAKKVFDRLIARDLVSWNALICGYVQSDLSNDVLNAFHAMLSEKVKPNTVTISLLLSIFSELSVLIMCKEAHGYILRHGFESNVLMNNSLISTYAKCGDINSSLNLFERLSELDKVSWNSIMISLGMHGHTDEMIGLFEKMEMEGIKPDKATFTALLSACSHAGKVEKGLEYFRRMTDYYKLEPQLEHYTCLVDLLGRANHLKEAYDLILSMPCVPDDRIWGSLLGSCKSYGNMRLAEVVADQIFRLDPNNIGYRVLLGNIYSDYGNRKEERNVRSEIKCRGLVKSPGCSWVEVDNNISIFIAGDHSHTQFGEICATLESLTVEIAKVSCDSTIGDS